MLPVSDKPVIWLGDTRETIGGFPDDVRRIAGFQIWRVQRGLEPNDWKPMPGVGLGVQEIRIRTGAVYVLHAFEKRTRQAPKADLDLAKRRLRALISQRTRRKG